MKIKTMFESLSDFESFLGSLSIAIAIQKFRNTIFESLSLIRASNSLQLILMLLGPTRMFRILFQDASRCVSSHTTNFINAINFDSIAARFLKLFILELFSKIIARTKLGKLTSIKMKVLCGRHRDPCDGLAL